MALAKAINCMNGRWQFVDQSDGTINAFGLLPHSHWTLHVHCNRQDASACQATIGLRSNY